MSGKYKRAAVLFSGGLDSGVLVADALTKAEHVRPLYVGVGFAWEEEERTMALRLFEQPPFARAERPIFLQFDMRDVFPATHWAVRGEPPAFDTPDEDVYLTGRNIMLVSKAAIYCAQKGIRRIAMA